MSGGHDYTSNLEYIRRDLADMRDDLKDVDKKLDKHGNQLSAISQHLSTLNGNVERNEGDIKELESTVSVLRERTVSGKVKQEGTQGFVERVKDNWWGILQAILIAIILTQVAP